MYNMQVMPKFFDPKKSFGIILYSASRTSTHGSFQQTRRQSEKTRPGSHNKFLGSGLRMLYNLRESGTPSNVNTCMDFMGMSTKNIRVVLWGSGNSRAQVTASPHAWDISSIHMYYMLFVIQNTIKFTIHQNPCMKPFLLDIIFGVVGIYNK